MFKLKEKVAMCYDGKWGRTVEGHVVAKSKPESKKQWIRVKFIPWGNLSNLDKNLRKNKFTHYNEFITMRVKKEDWGRKCICAEGYLRPETSHNIMNSSKGDFYRAIKLCRIKRHRKRNKMGVNYGI